MTQYERIPSIGTEREGATLVRIERCISAPSPRGAVVLHWQRPNGTGFATAIVTHPRACCPPDDPNLDF
ncbi:hypothetical protein [Tropicimonas sediminicola]|uniref:Uncharacterized protein n=1 Tax=Tropicimonas sediminicola TaxID=1031541 RepID=A0A239M5Y6_9RHOB|nr:hypothetical protein [Tropicimonas sediminicola]SNT38125.1 hypothetical protein SAMN05421757_11369 [Tropicimonas sediminicola]